jgi:dTDP-4-amino-4,6-dideoxygalactose transaminase
MSDVLAAFLYGQLEKWREIQAKRRAIWERYDMELVEWAKANGVRRPMVPRHCEQAWHMYYLIMPSLKKRTEFIARLKKQGISAVFHYLPLNQSGFIRARQKSWSLQDCPISEKASERLVRLPFYTSMSSNEQTQVIKAIKEFKN